jgi:hypothetical protein
MGEDSFLYKSKYFIYHIIPYFLWSTQLFFKIPIPFACDSWMTGKMFPDDLTAAPGRGPEGRLHKSSGAGPVFPYPPWGIDKAATGMV